MAKNKIVRVDTVKEYLKDIRSTNAAGWLEWALYVIAECDKVMDASGKTAAVKRRAKQHRQIVKDLLVGLILKDTTDQQGEYLLNRFREAEFNFLKNPINA